MTPQIRAAAAEHSEKEAKCDKLHATVKRKKIYHTRPPDPLKMNGATVFFDATVSHGQAAPPDAELLLRSLRMASVQSRAGADIIVTRNPSEGERNRLAASLTGAHVVSLQSFRSAFKSGPRIKYKRATSVVRYVWISSQFAANRPDATEMIKAAIRMHRSRWRRIPNKRVFLIAAAAAASSGNKFKTLGLVTAAQKRSQSDLRECPCAITLAELFKLISRIDFANSSTGVCGR